MRFLRDVDSARNVDDEVDDEGGDGDEVGENGDGASVGANSLRRDFTVKALGRSFG